MPQITNEMIDNTGLIQSNLANFVVYIPGFSTNTVTEDTIPEPVLCSSLSEFRAAFGSKPAIDSDDNEDLSYVMAYQLLSLGMPVLYQNVLKSSDGAVDSIVFATKMGEKLNDSTFWDRLKDRNKYKMRFLTTGSYPQIKLFDDGAAALSTTLGYMFGVAEKRGDCTVLVDHEKAEKITKDKVKKAFGEKDGECNIKTVLGEHGTYGSMFTPWGQFKAFDFAATTSVVFEDNKTYEAPGSLCYLSALANSINNGYSFWLSSAGTKRGLIPNFVKPLYDYSESEIENYLQKDAGSNDGLISYEDSGICVNPIVNIRPYGYIIWGNRTLLNNKKALKASSYMNILQIVTALAAQYYEVATGLMFEQNDDILWINLKAGMKPLLDKMVTGSGLAQYKWTKLKPDTKGMLKAQLTLEPIEAVERFKLSFVLNDSELTTTIE